MRTNVFKHLPALTYTDDGYSGTWLDRPALDELRDHAREGRFDVVVVLSPDRLARRYAYQVLLLEELKRAGIEILFCERSINDSPDDQLLLQIQGAIAEYERAKITERYRRGKLFRSRAGEVIAWKTPYGYQRLPRDPAGPARLMVFEPEAAIVRRIFADYTAGGHSIREIVRRLCTDGVPPPTGQRPIWGTSTISRILHNEAYIGRVYFNRTEAIPDHRPGRRSKQIPRPRDEWIPITVPSIVDEVTFEAVNRITRDNSKWSPRRADTTFRDSNFGSYRG